MAISHDEGVSVASEPVTVPSPKPTCNSDNNDIETGLNALGDGPLAPDRLYRPTECRRRRVDGVLALAVFLGAAALTTWYMLNVYSPSDPARVFVWSGSDQPGFVFPELDPEGPWGIPALQARPNIGLALSGGGYRAATLALGWVRALHVLGVLPHLRYIASNSGGSWFNGALSYGGYPVGAFLGPYAPPAALNRDALASSSLLPAGSWGDTVAAKSIIPDAVKDIIGDLFAPSHESVGGWTHSITENFLRPYGLGLQNSSITALGTRGEVATRLAAAYPGVPLYAAMATPDRAYPIVLGSIMDVNTDRVFYPFEITPLYAGAPARFPGLDPPIGAGFLEPLGFNSPAPSNPPRGAPAVGLQGAVNVTPERLVPLATYLGISSSFVAQGLRPASSSGFTLTGTERLQYWNTLDYKGARLSFADGGGADNLAVAPLLRRRVKHVVVAVAACTSADVAAADWAVAQYDVAGLFGAVPLNATQYEGFKEGITGVQPDVWNRALQVFPREGFDELYAALQERLREGRPAVHRASYTVLDNPGQAIQGGWSVDVLWLINMKVDAWEEQLPDDTRDFLKHVRNEAGSDMRHYPYINLYNTYYSRELVTLMSQQASWTTLQAAPELRDMLAQAAADTPKSPSPSGTAAAGDAAGAARVAPAEGGDGSAAAPAATATAAPAEATSASGSGPAGGMEPSEDGSTATAMSMPPPSAPEATSSAGAAKVDAPDSSTVEGAGAGAGAGAATTAGGANGAGVGAVAALLTATTPAIEPDVAAVTEAAAQRPLPTAAGLEAFLRQPAALQLAGALPPPPRDTQEGTGTAEGVDASAAGLPAAARKPEVSYIIMNLVDKGARTERNGAGGSGSTPVHIVGPDVTDALAATAAAATGQTGAAGARGGAVRAVDTLVWKSFGPSYLENVQSAGITYWLIAALDPATSIALAEAGAAAHCFNAPWDKMPKRDKAAGSYKWGSSHWKDTTWNKVHIAKAVYEYGVHIIHSDTDVTWFNDPLPYFHGEQWSKVHVAMATDALLTQNPVGDVGPELGTSPHWNINTGIYFFRQWPGGLDFYNAWLGWEPRNVGHDQDGFNYLVRGQWFHGDRDMPTAVLPAGTPWDNRYFWAAFSNTTAISFLPASSFGNAYTYVNARLYEKLKHPLYEVHWVWGGKTIESKRQNMRDAMKFHDPPEYYTEPNLISFDLEHMQPPDGYNSWPEPQTERMVRFHVEATNRQLAQAYWAFAAALVANRTLVMPKFLCYCSKNWYQTHACRVNNEPATTFPFVCALSQVMKVKALEQGLGLPGSTDYSGHRVFIREYSYLDNPKVPTRLKQSLLEVVTLEPRPAFVHDPAQLIRKIGPSPRGYGSQVVVHAPLSDVELRALFTLAPFREARVVHIAQPHKLFKGFTRPETQAQFDEEIQKKAAYWCCRTPVDMKAMNASDRMQLSLLPPERHGALPRLGPDSHAQYLQDLGPVVPRTEPVM